ncbi:unnamed protein product [Pleuronectes platessa]|uniref:Uncharacterized protein n=1 Tax=Pleuronectes platessa TaxID=8262 RepID=A0A9N7YIW7_PLEPL|nr:unnamed protein product [Pleuronectes platessa]
MTWETGLFFEAFKSLLMPQTITHSQEDMLKRKGKGVKLILGMGPHTAQHDLKWARPRPSAPSLRVGGCGGGGYQHDGGVQPILEHRPRSLTQALKVKGEGPRAPAEVGFQPPGAQCTPPRTP